MQRLYSSLSQIDEATVYGAINGKKHLVFLFSYVYSASSIKKFAMYAHKGFRDAQMNDGV